MSGPHFFDLLTKVHTELKIFFTSGYTAGTAVGRGSISEGAALLTKPFAAAQLEKTLHEILA